MAGEYYVALFIILGSVISVFLALGFGLNKVHNPIKLFFIWFALLLFVPTANLGMEVAEAAALPADVQEMASTIYWAIAIINMISTVYLGYFFTKTIISHLLGMKVTHGRKTTA